MESWGEGDWGTGEAGSYLRRIDFVYHSTLGLRVIKKKKKFGRAPLTPYRGTSLIRTPPPLGTNRRLMPRALWWS